MRRRSPVLLAAVVIALVLGTGAAPADAKPRPVVLAAVGDSITRAFDARASRPLEDDPASSWATGSRGSVRSLASRLRSRGVDVSVHNDAVTGASVADLDDQLTRAAHQRATRVTVLIGANDVCAASVGRMTSAGAFRSRFAAALRHFSAARPDATIAVASIPDVHLLWTALHTDRAARSAWSTYGFCPSMLSAQASAEDRTKVVARLRADNASLAAVCRRTVHCRFDGPAVYRAAFAKRQISTVDYFHPSLSGQALLARTAARAFGWD